MLEDSLQIIGPAIAVFSLHVVAIACLTLRVLFTTKGLELQTAAAGFFEALAYVLAIGLVVQSLGNVVNLVAYGMGFSAGTILGLRVEQRLAYGYVTIHAFARPDGESIADAVRSAGFGATVQVGQGRSGPVGIVISIIPRKEAQRVTELIRRVDSNAFISSDDTRGVIRGWLGMRRRAPASPLLS
jgi:uncharacterized protein YebE (UPF0316 family)